MKRSLIVAFSFILLGVTSCGVTSVQNGSGSMISSSVVSNTVKQAENAEKSFNERVNSLPEATAAERTTLRNAVMDMDAGKCEALKDTKEYQRCQMVVFTSLASKNKDISYCEKIPMKTSAESCVESVVFQKSISDGNAALCESLSTDSKKAACKDNFYYSTAGMRKDMKECDRIANNDVKNTCFDTISLSQLSLENTDSTLCDTLKTEAAKNQCGTFVSDLASARAAIEGKKLVDCDKLVDLGVKAYCQAEVHLALAKDTKDKAHCTTLNDGFQIAEGKTKNYQTECKAATE